MNKKYLILGIASILFVSAIMYFSHSSASNNPTAPTPTANPAASVEPVVEKTSKCLAIKLDPNDSQAFAPDPSCTPGVINSAVSQENIKTTICQPGFTSSIRPSASYTNKIKLQQIVDYGFTDTNVKDYEEDHFISLELGGDPKDPKNLWPEPHGSPNEKDKVENYLHREVCSGAITLSEAQKEISTNWFNLYKQISM